MEQLGSGTVGLGAGGGGGALRVELEPANQSWTLHTLLESSLSRQHLTESD